MSAFKEYFDIGSKVSVTIPMVTGMLHDWAIVKAIDGDLVRLQMSRDLPVDTSLPYGQIFDIRGGKESVNCCRAIIVSGGRSGMLSVRVVSEIDLDENRAFYRVDTFLPFKYFPSREQEPGKVATMWLAVKKLQHQIKAIKNNTSWHPPPSSTEGGTTHQEMVGGGPVQMVIAHETATDSSWDHVIPLAANISGGGIRFNSQQKFETGTFIHLEIFMPHPQRLVDAIAQVIFANSTLTGGGVEQFDTALTFTHIEEVDRDAIVSYSTYVQQSKIREANREYLSASIVVEQPSSDRYIRIAIIAFALLSFLTLVYALVVRTDSPDSHSVREIKIGP